MMDWQLIMVCVAIAGALAYVGRRVWQTWSGRGAGCGGKCGCSQSAGNERQPKQIPIIPTEELTLRMRQ